MGVKNARETLTQMIEGKLGSHIMPDIESYNILLEVWWSVQLVSQVQHLL